MPADYAQRRALLEGIAYGPDYEGWQTVQAFLAADAKVPSEEALPRPPMREVARMLADRREFRVLKVVDALAAFAQPELLATEEQQAEVVETREAGEVQVQTVVVPEAREVSP